VKQKILFFLGLLPLALTSQTYQITGSVRDMEGAPLPFANVLLLKASDSLQITGASADDQGQFALRQVPPDLYYLKATYFGYGSILVPLEVRSDIRIGALVLEPDENTLEEVVVTGQRPTVERKADRIVFNVENTVMSEGSTWDILRNAPGVIVVQENLEIRGQQATVYLNDRKVQLSQDEILELLKGLSGDVISAVEVIPMPPASFEADDGPVLNIRTRQNIVPGYSGSVRGQYTQAVFPKYSFGTNHYYKAGKVGVFANYTIILQGRQGRGLCQLHHKPPQGIQGNRELYQLHGRPTGGFCPLEHGHRADKPVPGPAGFRDPGLQPFRKGPAEPDLQPELFAQQPENVRPGNHHAGCVRGG
jgi:hypothetical protein